MKQMFLILAAIVMLCACQKNNSAPGSPDDQNNQPPPKNVSDTLMVYAQTLPSGKSVVQTKFFKTNETKTVLTDASDPFATALRVVYIKGGTTLGFARLDGVSRLLAQLTQASNPTLSIDSRLICVVDKPADKYQLLLYDTIGNKTTLFETTNEITSPAFTSDGQKVVFVQKSINESSLFIIPITGGGVAKKVTTSTPGYYDDYCTVTNQTVYFVRSHSIDSTLSSEIFSSDLGGSSIKQISNFTNNWSTASFWIRNLRKVANVIDSSSLICVSNYNSPNSEVYLYKIGGGLTPMTQTDEMESSPSMIANYSKE
jgi:hypothetical protein